MSTVPAVDFDVVKLSGKGVQYVVMTSNLSGDGRKDFMKELGARADIIKEFSVYNDGLVRVPFDNVDETFMPISDSELFSRKHTGPCLIVYKMREEKK